MRWLQRQTVKGGNWTECRALERPQPSTFLFSSMSYSSFSFAFSCSSPACYVGRTKMPSTFKKSLTKIHHARKQGDLDTKISRHAKFYWPWVIAWPGHWDDISRNQPSTRIQIGLQGQITNTYLELKDEWEGTSQLLLKIDCTRNLVRDVLAILSGRYWWKATTSNR